MALPTVKTLTHTLNAPEIGDKIKYRAMTVGEQKLLITAMELGEEDALVDVIIDIVNACTFEKIDIRKLPTHLVDFLYLRIHAKSTGEKSKASFTCTNPVPKPKKVKKDVVGDDGEITQVEEEIEEFEACGTAFNVMIPLDKAEIIYPQGYDEGKVIMIDDTTGIKLKVPNLEDFKKIRIDSEKIFEVTDDFIFSCIDSVFTEDSVQVPGTDFSSDEFRAWMENLDGSVIEKMDAFFKTMPVLGLDLPIRCPSCKKEHTVELRGLEDFFV